MGVFAMFRRKKKGAAEDAAVATEAAAVTEATETDVTTDITEDGGVTRVVVAGLTAPVGSETAEPALRESAPTESALRESAPEESVSDRSASDGSAADESASRASSGEGASEAESEEAIAEVVEIPRQQSVDTAADTDSETGETARR